MRITEESRRGSVDILLIGLLSFLASVGSDPRLVEAVRLLIVRLQGLDQIVQR